MQKVVGYMTLSSSCAATLLQTYDLQRAWFLSHLGHASNLDFFQTMQALKTTCHFLWIVMVPCLLFQKKIGLLFNSLQIDTFKVWITIFNWNLAKVFDSFTLLILQLFFCDNHQPIVAQYFFRKEKDWDFYPSSRARMAPISKLISAPLF